MSRDEYSKKHLEEAGLGPDDSRGAERVIEALRAAPGALKRAEPPLGYEAELLAALRRRLPLDAKAAAPVARARRFWHSPNFAWSMSGVFALSAVLTILNYRPSGPEDVDLLAQTARKGGTIQVGAWLASVGDSSVQRRIAMVDMDAAAKDLSSPQNRKVVEDVLRDVARTMGMK